MLTFTYFNPKHKIISTELQVCSKMCSLKIRINHQKLSSLTLKFIFKKNDFFYSFIITTHKKNLTSWSFVFIGKTHQPFVCMLYKPPFVEAYVVSHDLTNKCLIIHKKILIQNTTTRDKTQNKTQLTNQIVRNPS